MSTEASEAAAAWILSQQASREQAYARRQAAKQAARADHQERRRRGLIARHAAKLARLREA